jgi:hypothetical protein
MWGYLIAGALVLYYLYPQPLPMKSSRPMNLGNTLSTQGVGSTLASVPKTGASAVLGDQVITPDRQSNS